MSVLSTAALCALYLHHEGGLFGPHAGAKHADVLAGTAQAQTMLMFLLE